MNYEKCILLDVTLMSFSVKLNSKLHCLAKNGVRDESCSAPAGIVCFLPFL